MKVALSREEVLLSEESQLSGEEKLAENKGYDDSDLQGSILHRVWIGSGVGIGTGVGWSTDREEARVVSPGIYMGLRAESG
jgi:hypothetical protein